MPTITDWLMVIITGIYVIATVFICGANIKSANAAKQQTIEMKQQFYAVNRPNISVEVVYLKKAFWILRFTNYGTQTAFNTRITLNEEFINSVEEKIQPILRENNGRVYTLGVNQSYDLYFGTNEYRSLAPKVKIMGKIIYSGYNNSLYAENFEIETENYATFFSVSSETEDLIKKLNEQNKEIANIRHVLDKIAIQMSSEESTDNKSD